MKFKLEKKSVVKVRYYETMFIITDNYGERVYVGSDQKTANEILKTLNRETLTRTYRKRKAGAKKKRGPGRPRKSK